MTDSFCIHGLEPITCSICLHGPSRPVEDTSECRSCGAEILWVVTENGKRMPMDVDPTDDGTFVKVRREANGDKVVAFVKVAARPTETRARYCSHFATCPEAEMHRRG